ncbi:MAG: REP-associated tyrosine transposase [Thermoguttaceae bacterium]
MESQPGHRKRIKHYQETDSVHELTFSCYQRRPLLNNDAWRGMLAESIDRAMDGHRYRLTAFVFMPEHVHLMVYPIPGADGVDALLKAIKRPFSYRVKQLLVQSRSKLIETLTLRQRPGVTTFRYWQEGPGYDRNLTEPSAVLTAIDYLHNNPVRRGLVKTAVEWKWSSARYYLIDPPRQYPGLPFLHSLPAEWLNETD